MARTAHVHVYVHVVCSRGMFARCALRAVRTVSQGFFLSESRGRAMVLWVLPQVGACAPAARAKVRGQPLCIEFYHGSGD